MINKIGTFKDYNDGTLKTVFDVGDGHIPELLESACAVDPGGLVVALGHALDAHHENRHGIAEVFPNRHGDDRAHRGGSVSEKGGVREAQHTAEIGNIADGFI